MAPAHTTPALLRPPARTVLRPPVQPQALPGAHQIRITGVLEHDAELRYTPGAHPHALLILQIQPPRGLRYAVTQNLGTDPTDHMHAESRLAGLRRGALVSATGGWLRLQMDHGHQVLVLERCTAVVLHSPQEITP